MSSQISAKLFSLAFVLIFSVFQNINSQTPVGLKHLFARHASVSEKFISFAVPQDDKRLLAEKLVVEAAELMKEDKADNRREAAKKYGEALKIWTELKDEKKQAEVLKALVQISNLDSDVKNALIYARQSLEIYQKLGDRMMEAEMLNNIAGFYDSVGETRTGLEYINKAVGILRVSGDKKRYAIALNGMGMFYSNIGEMKLAIDNLENSLALRRETGDRLGEARTLVNLGATYDDLGEKRKAIRLYEQAAEIILQEKDWRMLAVTLNNLALSQRDIGEYQKSLDNYQKSLELRRQVGDKRGEATTLNNIATIYRTFGEYREALNLLEQALTIYQAGNFRRNVATTYFSLGAIYGLLDDDAKALEYYQKSLDTHRAIENKSGIASALRRIAGSYARQNQLTKATATIEEARKLSEEGGELYDIAYLALLSGQTYERLGDKAQAESNYKKALEIFRRMEDKQEIADALYHYAQFDERNGQTLAAIEKMREVLGILEDLRNNIAGPNFRTSYFSAQQNYFDFYISLLVKQHRAEPDKNYDKTAFQTSEKARARRLLESLGESQADIFAGIAPELLAAEKQLRQNINAKESQRLDAVRQTNSAKAAVYEKEIAGLIQKYRDLQTEIRLKSPQFAELTQSEPATLNEIQNSVLNTDTVLLEYFLGEEKSFLFLATGQSLDVVELPAQAEIDRTARAYVENLRARAASDAVLRESADQREKRIRAADETWRREAKKLSDVLLAPVAAKIKNKRLLIVASGVLQYVPFASLPSPDTANQQLLIETNEIVNLPSASTLTALRQWRKNKKLRSFTTTAAVLADPVFALDDVRVKSLAKQRLPENQATPKAGFAGTLAPQLRADFTRLRFSRQEAMAISALLPADKKFVALDFAASLDAVSAKNFADARIIHLATHGLINSDLPELSGVILSQVDEDGEAKEGFLRLHDIYNLRLGADLVVLSACETALGREIKGEGIVGLTRGFMYAGSPAVVASLWKVDDRATAELMKRFYANLLRANLPPAAALRQSQISMLREKATQNPFYWAAFTLQGDWQTK